MQFRSLMHCTLYGHILVLIWQPLQIWYGSMMRLRSLGYSNIFWKVSDPPVWGLLKHSAPWGLPPCRKDPQYFRNELMKMRNDPRNNPNHGRSMEDQEFWNEVRGQLKNPWWDDFLVIDVIGMVGLGVPQVGWTIFLLQFKLTNTVYKATITTSLVCFHILCIYYIYSKLSISITNFTPMDPNTIWEATFW